MNTKITDGYKKSTTEEILAVLWGIAGLTALNGGHTILATLLLLKALLDMLCSIWMAIPDVLEEIKNARNKN